MRKEPLIRSRMLRGVGGRVAAWALAGSALLGGGAASAAGQEGRDGSSAVAVGPWHASGGSGEAGVRGVGGAAGERLEAARTQIALGNARAALALLDSAAGPAGVEAGIVRAEANFQLGNFETAADLFREAARRSPAEGVEAALWWARAGDAAERSGNAGVAARAYRRAAEGDSPARGWIRMRQARVTAELDAARTLLAEAPEAGLRLARIIEAEASEASGAVTRAIELYAALGLYARGARLSLERGHRTLARELTYAALARRAERQAREAAALATEEFPPENPIEVDQLARALARHGRAREAAALVAEWVVGDSSETMFALLGEMKEAAADRWGALAAYEAAAVGTSAVAGQAEYRRIRLLVRMRRTTSAVAALQAFPVKFPAHDRTPWAVYLLGDLWWDVRQRAASDSVFELLDARWPNSRYAVQARYRLAARALLRRDTVAAIERFEHAARTGGDRARSSGFQLGILLRATGQTERARTAFTRLALEDSVGYYGMIAREAAGLPLPHYPPPDPVPAPPPVRELLATLDFLDQAGFSEEAEALVDYAVESGDLSPDEQLALAEGLVDRNRTIRAIRLGWQLTRHFTLNHPRLVRVIFPFPNRMLVTGEAAKFDLDPYLVAGMIRQESAFDVDAVSRAGARGLMQLMPATARGLARRQGLNWTNTFLTVADANVHVGTAHLAALLRQYQGRVEHALAAYNAGGRPVRRWLRYPEVGDRHRWIERIPYAETRGYLKTVLRNRDLYRALYGDQLIP